MEHAPSFTANVCHPRLLPDLLCTLCSVAICLFHTRQFRAHPDESAAIQVGLFQKYITKYSHVGFFIVSVKSVREANESYG